MISQNVIYTPKAFLRGVQHHPTKKLIELG